MPHGWRRATPPYRFLLRSCGLLRFTGRLDVAAGQNGESLTFATDCSPPIFARVNKAGTPVAGLIIVGILMTIFQLRQAFHQTRPVNRVWFFCLGHLYTGAISLHLLLALLLLGHGHFGKACPAYLAVTSIAFLYCIWAVVGSGAKEVMWSFVTLMVITAMYALNYNRRHKNPYPLDAPISKD